MECKDASTSTCRLSDDELLLLKQSMGELTKGVSRVLFRILIPPAHTDIHLAGAKCNTADGADGRGLHDAIHGCNMTECTKRDGAAKTILILHHDHVSQMRDPWIECTNPGYVAGIANNVVKKKKQYSVLRHSCVDLAMHSSRATRWQMGPKNYFKVREFELCGDGEPRETYTDVFMVTPSILITLRTLQMLNKIVFDEKCGTQSGLRRKLIHRYHDVMENAIRRDGGITDDHHTSPLIYKFLERSVVTPKVATVIFRRLWWTQWVHSVGM